MSQKPYHLAVRAIIQNDQGQCLLIRRSGACRNFVGKWEWPGGKTDDGETFESALLREIREETGLNVELKGVAGAFGMEMDKIRVAVLCMEAVPVAGTLTLSDEHDDHAWVPLAEMLEWDLVASLHNLARSYIAAAQNRKE